VAQAMIRFAAARRAHLSAEILSSNEASLRLHARAGFERAGADDGRERHVLAIPTTQSCKSDPSFAGARNG
jgi:RimJ/RimL family protein N-acetyltransferase